MSSDIVVPIHAHSDVVRARQQGRALANAMTFTSTDATLITTAISELARNIVRYANHGEIIITTGTADGTAYLTVENTGPPVPPYEVPALFEPFRRLPATERLADSTTVSTSRGAGLGLSIVRSVAQAHGGEVSAAPREGGGLTVRVRLPARRSSPHRTPQN